MPLLPQSGSRRDTIVRLMIEVRIEAAEPKQALARLHPQITSVALRHGFVPEAAGEDWAHWIRSEDDKIVLRAYLVRDEPRGLSLVVTGGCMPPELERDLRQIRGR